MPQSEKIIIEVENRFGEKLELTDIRNGLWLEQEVKGLGAEVQLNTVAASGFGSGRDGSIVVSSAFPERTILMTLSVRGPKAKAAFDRMFRPGENTIFYFTCGDKKRKIEGYTVAVGDREPGKYPSSREVSLYCHGAYFTSLSDVWGYIAHTVPLWKFPFTLSRNPETAYSRITPSLIASIENDGDVECGVIWTIRARGAVRHPKITNINTRESMAVEMDLAAGDVLTIDTTRQLSVTLERGMQISDAVNWFFGDFLTARPLPEKNEFRYSALENERNMEIRWALRPKYRTV